MLTHRLSLDSSFGGKPGSASTDERDANPGGNKEADSAEPDPNAVYHCVNCDRTFKYVRPDKFHLIRG
jgi:hypothetical protein